MTGGSSACVCMCVCLRVCVCACVSLRWKKTRPCSNERCQLLFHLAMRETFSFPLCFQSSSTGTIRPQPFPPAPSSCPPTYPSHRSPPPPPPLPIICSFASTSVSSALTLWDDVSAPLPTSPLHPRPGESDLRKSQLHLPPDRKSARWLLAAAANWQQNIWMASICRLHASLCGFCRHYGMCLSHPRAECF